MLKRMATSHLALLAAWSEKWERAWWYHLSFWSISHQSRTGCAFQIPYMAGFLGNLVVLLPNGISAFQFADGNNYDVDPMVLAGEALRPFPCPAGSR
jgi:hypothetical protein